MSALPNPYGLSDKEMEEIKAGNVLGGRVVDGRFYADWNYYIEISDEALKSMEE